MKKLLLLSVSILFMSCQEVEKKREEIKRVFTPVKEISKKPNYTIEQCFFNGDFKTYVWYRIDSMDRSIVKSYSIDTDIVTRELIIRDSIRANNFILRIEKVKK